MYQLEPRVGVYEVAQEASEWRYRNVQTVLKHIVSKGWLRKETAGKRLSLFTPVLSRDQAVRARLLATLERDYWWDQDVAGEARELLREVSIDPRGELD